MNISLPDGRPHPESMFNGIRHIVIERPRIGAVTVDRGSVGNVFGKAESVAEYTGRGWRDRLVADAVKWLGALGRVRRYSKGEYVSLVWDQGSAPPAHYVAGHVTDEEFRAELARMGKPAPPIGATVKHVYICNVRVANDAWGNRCYETRHCTSSDRGARAYWEIEPHRRVGA